jgi:hypothetical protein
MLLQICSLCFNVFECKKYTLNTRTIRLSLLRITMISRFFSFVVFSWFVDKRVSLFIATYVQQWAHQKTRFT